jgi:hypothetical protein
MSELGDRTARQERSAVARRTVLRTAGLLGLTGAGAAALSACAEGSGGSPSAAPAASQTSAATTPSPTAETTSPEPSAPTAAAPTGPSVATSKVPVGGGVILENADYVVTQPSKGKYKLSARSALTRDARSRPSATVSFTVIVTAVSIRLRTAP